MKKNRLGNVKILLIGVVVVSVIIGLLITTLMIMKKNRQESPRASQKAIEVINQATDQVEQKIIRSNLGFDIHYNPKAMNVEGIVRHADSTDKNFKGEYFTNREVHDIRDYSIVKLRFKADDTLISKQDDSEIKYRPMRPSLSITTNPYKNYFSDNLIKQYPDKSKIDILTLEHRKRLEKHEILQEIKQDTTKIGDISYVTLTVQKRHKTADGSLIDFAKDYHYLTVQNDRPYWISIYDHIDSGDNDVALLRSIIAKIKYHKPVESSLLSAQASNKDVAPVARLAHADNEFSDRSDIANVRDKISNKDMINVVARNQLATVRVGSMRCAKVSYKVKEAMLTLSNVCNGGVGSGSIISNDGVVATNGHVTNVSDAILTKAAYPKSQKEWQEYKEFLINSGLATEVTVNELYRKAVNDSESATKLVSYLHQISMDKITISDSKSHFVIQTSDDPIRINENGSDWKYTKTNKSAKLIVEEVDTNSGGFSYESTYTDVALLKMDGKFPTVDMSSLLSVRRNDEVMAIGYPAVVDDSVNTKNAKTLPTVTSGSVVDKGIDGGGHTLVVITAEIASGSSGGPLFDKNGKQIGINTYGGASCLNEKAGNSCFGTYGYARDAADISILAIKSNVSIKSYGELTTLWKDGLGQFTAGKYDVAAETFAKLNERYPDNYLVTKFLATAKEQAATMPNSMESDNVDNNKLILVVIIASLGGLLVVLSIIIMIILLSKRRHHATRIKQG